MTNKLILKILNGNRKGHVQELHHSASIGRSGAENELMLPDQTISGIHAMLTSDGQNWWVQDNQSANGTCVDQVAARAPVLLRAAGRLRLGPEVELEYAVVSAGVDAGHQRLVAENQRLQQEIARLEQQMAERPATPPHAPDQAHHAALIRLIDEGLGYVDRFGGTLDGLLSAVMQGAGELEDARKLLRAANRALSDLRAHFELARPE